MSDPIRNTRPSRRSGMQRRAGFSLMFTLGVLVLVAIVLALAWFFLSGNGADTGDAPLIALGLVQLEEQERPFLTRSLRAPDRVVSALLGDERPAPNVTVVDSVIIENDWVIRLAGVADAGERLTRLAISGCFNAEVVFTPSRPASNANRVGLSNLVQFGSAGTRGGRCDDASESDGGAPPRVLCQSPFPSAILVA